jgi:hypothetical protein
MRSLFFATRDSDGLFTQLNRGLIAEPISAKHRYVSVRRSSGISDNRIMDCLWTHVGGMFGRDLQPAIVGLNDQAPTAES